MKPPLIPPPVVAVLLGGAMWLADRQFPAARLAFAWLPLVAALLLIAALLLMGAAALAFRRHKTTINPLTPSRASNLITSGVYAVSRNPIYLGDVLLLAAFAVWLGNLINVVFVAGFVWIMNRFQIAAEEQALQALFGERYVTYCARVGRWL